jgi:S1-C subfamily serine protease
MTLSTHSGSLLATLSDELAEAVRTAGRSVVAVHGRRRFPASGLAWGSDQVVTAAHVLERDTDLHITSPGGGQHAARLVGRDSASDVAVLAVPGANLEPATQAPAGVLAPGQLTLAIGRPGTAEPIASFGAISSLGGAWRTTTGGVLDAYVRADVALLPGLSGGALVDVQGRLVGMLSAHLAGGDPVAIPTPSLAALVQHIQTGGGTLRRAYLGVSTQPLELQAGLRQHLGIEQTSGLMLLGLEPGAPADRAGLLVGDILLAIGERTVEDGEALQMALGPQAIGTPLPLRLIRGGALRQLTVTPVARPN